MSLRLTVRILAPSVAISLLLLALGGIGGWYVHRLQRDTSMVLDLDVRSIQAVEELVFSIYEIRSELTQCRLTGDRAHLDAVAGKKCEETQRWLGEAEALMDDDEEIRLIADVRKRYQDFLSEFRPALEESSTGGPPITSQLAGSEVLAQKVLDPAKQLLDREERMILERSKSNEGMAEKVAFVLLLLGTCGAVAGLVAGFGIARGVTRSIVELYVPIRIASGKLEEVIGPIDLAPTAGIKELDVMLRKLADQVRTVVDRLRQTELEVLRAEQLAALGQLAAGMAHELRNPLTAIKMLIESASEGGPSASLTGRDLIVLRKEVKRLERSIQMFLDFARPPKLEKRSGDVRTAIRETLDLVAAHASRQHVQICCDLTDRPVMIQADHEQLRQVFLNLVLNAVDALPKGGTITIALAPSDASSEAAAGLPAGSDSLDGSGTSQGEAWITLTVADDGLGVPAELGNRIFEPYVSTKDTGLGLGLAICRRIVEEHGGRITAENVQSGGALFTVRLPVGSAGAEETS
ncbi:MAG: sensor histidine kinase [Thermoguttaceae bacterium]|jgi:signal transduction histidine kinase